MPAKPSIPITQNGRTVLLTAPQRDMLDRLRLFTEYRTTTELSDALDSTADTVYWQLVNLDRLGLVERRWRGSRPEWRAVPCES